MSRTTRVLSRLVFACVLLTPLSHAQEGSEADGEVRYVTDNLYTFLHAGPGRNYRILGSVEAGTRVTQLQVDAENNFVEVIDDKQRTGWVDGTFITSELTIRERVPILEQRLQEANEQLAEQEALNQRLNQQVQTLTTQNEQVNKQLSELQSRNQDIQQELNTSDQTAQIQWFTRGGIVALASIILGVIIAYLPKKRRRNDQWM
ncbi:TIGR04211 family SH3 domain-containing protein [Aestuariibacter halophilus]|uniref:TIGR04211 family SH3 domain-containing protein n=1 Tax=Fluctibacter halophilus TaxID=226011 RepID=A0ABS8GBL1_9ALTE|nr:TIGR04211 family SH3 domain-containing protein [Aestuariibacter halophilus]MCC2617972.1 TIGR04211 family SH3 domain-containing protein [Aestuariibacter halophilus]